ncbi:nucleolar protein 12-domain-containing protein [Aspergillus caelatus]|uniref:Nucleolar protein 12-domain-containing protein n=2 Tax=Aspergillus subgen. Circumdati TaxID=2720871 RepID=A0A5N6ZUY0_9EURO|nr:nucleolar protein 12-domain-containing protein [Aspergillus caelatus]KAE8361424.1 nucleolar protein 12-domain-containing protein [Aspergillus caelatus]KAE8421498.1 nucleolar protein 12-domain-containing protein [Aspergillus pseudocaelatus]
MGPQAKRRKTSKVEEITFDHSARHEFLTGFRKRKQQRIKHAQEVAEQKAREMKREERKRIREEREAEFQNALEEHQKQLKRLRQEENGASSGSDSESDGEDNEWEGFEEPPAVDYEAEYIDEDKYTTVTVEEMDASREGLLRSQEHSSDEEQEGEEKLTSEANSKPKPVEKTKKASDKPKKKKKKFRYESKAERQLTRKKERLSNSRKAQARRER